MKAKEKFIGGDFRSYSGIASAMPLRQEGKVRPHGEYPRTPPEVRGFKAMDWHLVLATTEEAKDKQIAGPWRS